MRIVVVTPVGPDHGDLVPRARANVARAAAASCTNTWWVTVGDGPVSFEEPPPCAPVNFAGEHHISLPESAGNAGATPRAIGSAYAVGTLGADLVAFLDVDNEWEPNHLQVAAKLAEEGAEVIAASRLICHYDTGESMYADSVDSDGDKFADTNCIILAGTAVKFGATFDWPKPYASECAPSGADRVFWERLRRSFDRTRVATGVPTVRYRSPWLTHYLPQFKPPEVCKIAVADKTGNRHAVSVKPKQLWIQNQEQGTWHRVVGVDGDQMHYDVEPYDSDGLVIFGQRGWEVEAVE